MRDRPATVREGGPTDRGAYHRAMPELPEVETVRRALAPIIGRRVVEACLVRRDVLRVLSAEPERDTRTRRGPRRTGEAPAAALLNGCTIIDIRRRGKSLAVLAQPEGADVPIEHAVALGVHLGMTGMLSLAPARESDSAPPPHLHATWRLDDGAVLRFTDARRFGGLWHAPTFAQFQNTVWKSLGPDALAIADDELRARLSRTDRAVKAALLDQRVLAGVGNIYADEALFDAKIRPARRASKLKPAECAALACAIRAVLSRAVEAGGSTVRDYRNPTGEQGRFQIQHRVYGRGGEPCVQCGVELKWGTVGQRTTVWCARCQK